LSVGARVSKKLTSTAVRLIGPVLLVVLLLRLRDKAELGRVLAGASLVPLVGVVLLNAVQIHLKVIRWRLLLAKRGYRYGMGRAWGAMLSGMYLGLLTPGRVGDFLRVQYLRHDVGAPYAEGLAVIVMDRLCDIYVLLAFAVVGIARFASVINGKLAYATWAGVALTALGPLIFLVPGFAERLMRGVYARLSKGHDADGLDRFLAALRAQVGRGLAAAILLTFAAFAANYAQGYLISQSLGQGLAYFDVACVMSITGLLSLVPISIAGVGVREAFMFLVYPALGRSGTDGVAFGLVELVAVTLVQVGAGFVAWQIAPPPSGESAAAPEPTTADAASR
jgi:glycosyltransferase 2 family protein